VAEIRFVPATPELGQAVAVNMRVADQMEVWSLARLTPHEAVEHSLRSSTEAWVATVDDRPMIVFGCGPLADVPPWGVPWLLGVQGVEHHAREFLTMAPAYIERWAQQYHCLYNMVDQRNERAIRWLKRMGFQFHPAVPAGPDACPFLPFEMRR
jgi:hypothetical protein